jgi:hypothetical protein
MTERSRLNQQETFEIARDRKTDNFGLGPRPWDCHALARLLPEVNVAKPEGIAAANQLVDLLDLSESRAEASIKRANRETLMQIWPE